MVYSAQEPERLRGPQHGAAWCDEFCAWQYPETMEMLEFGLRLGDHPQKVITTTPKPTRAIRQLMNEDNTVISRGSTYDNKDNLPDSFFKQIIAKYDGTRLGKQEIYAELLEEAEGALWTRKTLDDNRIKYKDMPVMKKIVVGIDPAVSSGPKSDAHGIIVCGLGADGHGYVMRDVSLKGTPFKWGRQAVEIYQELECNYMVAEVNNGGELVERNIHTINDGDIKGAGIKVKMVRASRGKFRRAEPIASLYEQGFIHHVGFFSDLEDEMCTWDEDSDFSPDRMDALVWAFTDLMHKRLVEIKDAAIFNKTSTIHSIEVDETNSQDGYF